MAAATDRGAGEHGRYELSRTASLDEIEAEGAQAT
jgi:hypothetical protein